MIQATQFLPGNAKEFDNLLTAAQVDESATHLRPYASYYQTDPLAAVSYTHLTLPTIYSV